METFIPVGLKIKVMSFIWVLVWLVECSLILFIPDNFSIVGSEVYFGGLGHDFLYFNGLGFFLIFLKSVFFLLKI